LVGHENVFILTTSTRPYARSVNVAGGFGFRDDQIFSREDIEKHYIHDAYVGCSHAHEDNVLIDNLPSRENENKIRFVGIHDMHRYIKVRDYYGVNFPDETWLAYIKFKLSSM
jgi:hypothetical protein